MFFAPRNLGMSTSAYNTFWRARSRLYRSRCLQSSIFLEMSSVFFRDPQHYRLSHLPELKHVRNNDNLFNNMLPQISQAWLNLSTVAKCGPSFGLLIRFHKRCAIWQKLTFYWHIWFNLSHSAKIAFWEPINLMFQIEISSLPFICYLYSDEILFYRPIIYVRSA